MLPESSVEEFIRVAGQAIRGRKDNRADINRGSIYEQIYGSSALIWSREAQRDTDLFNVGQIDTADGDALTERIETEFGIQRGLDTYGTGIACIYRNSLSAGSGKIFAGTRISVPNNLGDISVYAVSRDTLVSATALTVELPIRATVFGVAGQIRAAVGNFIDAVWDNSWVISLVSCEPGTLFEEAQAYRARARATRKDQRVGYVTAMRDACVAAGATFVNLFDSNYANLVPDIFTPINSSYINVCYVSDQNYYTSSDLIRECTFALEGFRQLGDSIQVRPMSKSSLSFDLVLHLAADPGRFNRDAIFASTRAAIAKYFGGVSNGFEYNRESISGMITQANPVIQEVVFNTPVVDSSLLTAGLFPDVLTKYIVRDLDVNMVLRGPQ